MTSEPDPTVPVRHTTRSRGFVLSAGLLAAGFLALSFPIDAGGPRGGGSAPSRGSSGGHSYSGGGRSSSGGSRSYSPGPRSSSGTRSYVGGRSSSTGWRAWNSTSTSSAPVRRASGERSYSSPGAQSGSGPRTFTSAGSRGGSGGPPPSGGNPGGGHPGGGNPGGPPPSGGGHPGGGGGHPGGGSPGGGHHGGGYHGGGHHGWYCPPTYYAGSSWYWGGPWDWWWGWGGGWGWGPYGYGGGVYVINDGRAAAPDRYARVDTDVSPEAAEVYLDGTLIGSADDFDGYPDYLYLEKGRYKLEFRHPYYETIVKELDVRPGQGISINDEMKLLPGKKRLEVVDPEDHGTPLGRVFGKPEANASAQGPDRTGRFEAEGAMDSGGATGIEAQDVDVLPPVKPAADVSAAPSPAEIAPADRGRLRFEVEPDDAAVYLDDRYVGTGEELGDLRRGLAVKPGKHTVTVVRPGYATRTVDVEARPGAAIDVVIELEK